MVRIPALPLRKRTAAEAPMSACLLAHHRHKESPALAGLSVRRNVEPENRTCGYMIDREQLSSAVALTM
jgi:hypothetical protein